MSADLRGIGMTSQRARDRLVAQLRDMGIKSERVLEVIGCTPRHLFVDEALASRAYENSALPIGHGQTISQPYIVGCMTEALFDNANVNNVLEIGGGCGYQAAILAQLCERVLTIERIAVFANKLRERMHALKYHNVRVRHGDGRAGWAKYAPYDAILVAAAPLGVPDALREQLRVGGKLIIPVGSQGNQQLLAIARTEAGFDEQFLDWVSFVPLLEGIG